MMSLLVKTLQLGAVRQLDGILMSLVASGAGR